MHGFRRIDSDEPDGVALVLIANHQRISVNHPFDPGRDWPAAPLDHRRHRQYPGETHHHAGPPGPFLPQAPVGSQHGFTSRNAGRGCGDGKATGR